MKSVFLCAAGVFLFLLPAPRPWWEAHADDPAHSSSPTYFSAEEIERLPVNDLTELVELLPGVVRDRQGLLHFRGETELDLVVYVDGVPYKDLLQPFLPAIPLQAIESIELALADDASLGDTGPNAILITTKKPRTPFGGKLFYRTDDLGAARLNSNSFNSDLLGATLTGSDPLTAALLPTLGFSKLKDRLAFFVSGWGDFTNTYTPFPDWRTRHSVAGIPLADRQSNDWELFSRAAFTPFSGGGLTAGYDHARHWGTDYQHKFKYAPANAYRRTEGSSSASLRWEHLLSPKLSYDLSWTRQGREIEITPGGRRPDQFSTDPESASFYRSGGDTNRDGFIEYPGFDQWCRWFRYRPAFWITKASMHVVPLKSVRLSTGFEARRSRLEYVDIQYPYIIYDGPPDSLPYPGRGAIRSGGRPKPLWVGAYMQGDWSFRFLSGSAGVRGDYWDSGPGAYRKEFFRRYSPRLRGAVASSAGDSASIFWGRFYRLPSSILVSGTAYFLGDSPLKTDRANLSLSPRPLEGIRTRISPYGARTGWSLRGVLPAIEPEDYLYTKGLEVSLQRKIAGGLSARLEYDLAYVQWKVTMVEDDPRAQRPHPQWYTWDWDRRHRLLVFLGFAPRNGDWHASLVWDYRSGLPYTFSPPGYFDVELPLYNGSRLPSTSSADLRVTRRFRLRRSTLSATLQVTNLFDRTNVLDVYQTSGRPDTPYYLDAPDAVVREGQYQLWSRDPKTISGYYADPLHWGPRRNIQLGFGLEW